jgi:hypothetical protein
MECKAEKNRAGCNCSYEPCSRKGMCCECLDYHRSMGELPACLFSKEDERTYDRSVRNFIRSRKS